MYGVGFYRCRHFVISKLRSLSIDVLREGHGHIIRSGPYSYEAEGAGFLAALACIVLGLLAFINRLPTIPTDWPQ